MRKLQSLLLACLIFTSAESCVQCPEHTERIRYTERLRHTESLENTEFLLEWKSVADRRGTFDGFPKFAIWSEIKEVQPGESQGSVRGTFGRPQASRQRDGATEWNWQVEWLGDLSSLTIRFINDKVSESPEFRLAKIPEFMLNDMTKLKPGISDTQVIREMGEKPTSIVMVGSRATYVWEHTSRIRRSGSKDRFFYHGTPYWIIGDGLYHFSVKVHIENGKQVGDAIVEEGKVR